MQLAYYIPMSPGSKCWLLRAVRVFLGAMRPAVIAEPFAGSAIVSLWALSHGFTKRIVLGEKDSRLFNFWRVALSDAGFARRVSEWTRRLYALAPKLRTPFIIKSLTDFEVSDPAFWVLLRSRTSFNGNLQSGVIPGNGKRTKWPITMGLRLRFLYERRGQIELKNEWFELVSSTNKQGHFMFVDPVYNLTPQSPGWSLYRECDVKQEAVLATLASWKGAWQFTAEACSEMVILLAAQFSKRSDVDWNVVSGPAGSSDGELLIGRKPRWVVTANRAFGEVGLARLQKIIADQRASRALETQRNVDTQGV